MRVMPSSPQMSRVACCSGPRLSSENCTCAEASGTPAFVRYLLAGARGFRV
jgi:hypothetical protein